MKQKYTKTLRRQMKIAARRKEARRENGIKLGLYYERHPGERPIKKDFTKRNQLEGTVFTPEPIEGSAQVQEPGGNLVETVSSVLSGDVSQVGEGTRGKER